MRTLKKVINEYIDKSRKIDNVYLKNNVIKYLYHVKGWKITEIARLMDLNHATIHFHINEQKVIDKDKLKLQDITEYKLSRLIAEVDKCEGKSQYLLLNTRQRKVEALELCEIIEEFIFGLVMLKVSVESETFVIINNKGFVFLRKLDDTNDTLSYIIEKSIVPDDVIDEIQSWKDKEITLIESYIVEL